MIFSEYMICAIIPTYNNVKTIEDVVRRTLRYIPVIVVNDGSTDGTTEVLDACQCMDGKCMVISLSHNYGKGYALKIGFQKARSLGYSHVVTLDGDGQHFPEDIPALLHLSRIRPEAIIVGSRGTKHDNMPSQNTFANKFSNFWFAIQTGLVLPDTQTGFRIYPLHNIHGEHLMTKRYEAELLVLVLSAWACVPIISSPIRVYYPPRDERVSSFRPFKDFLRIFMLNSILCTLSVVYGLPRRYWRTICYAFCFLFFAIVGNIITFIYRVNPSLHAEKVMHRRIQLGSRIFLSVFPKSKYVVDETQCKLNRDEPAIYIANHTSYLDIVAFLALHDRMRLIGRANVLDNIFYGNTAQMIGFIPLGTGIEEMLSVIKHWTDKGYSVGIFPEGTRSMYGEPLRFRLGAFYIAEQLKLPIQPLLLQGYSVAVPKRPVFAGAAIEMRTTVLPRIRPDDTSFGLTMSEKARQMRLYYDQLLTMQSLSEE